MKNCVFKQKFSCKYLCRTLHIYVFDNLFGIFRCSKVKLLYRDRTLLCYYWLLIPNCSPDNIGMNQEKILVFLDILYRGVLCREEFVEGVHFGYGTLYF